MPSSSSDDPGDCSKPDTGHRNLKVVIPTSNYKYHRLLCTGVFPHTNEVKILEMNQLITDWCELMHCGSLIPDTTNWENTGISPVHVHYIMCKMWDEGSKPFFSAKECSHELPIVMHKTSESRLGCESVLKWGQAILDYQGVLPEPSEHICMLDHVIDGKAVPLLQNMPKGNDPVCWCSCHTYPQLEGSWFGGQIVQVATNSSWV